MRRIFVFPLLLLACLTFVVAMAQDEPPPDDPTPDAVETWANSDFLSNLYERPFAVVDSVGSDTWTVATAITVGQGGIQIDVADFDVETTDPILNCMWGVTTPTQGYRTVWYQFTPDANGIVTISTLPAYSSSTVSYDTVLAVHTGSCSSLATVACNDDRIGFSSTVTLEVKRNVTYYIEVADWEAGGNASKILDLSMQINPYDTLWQNANTIPSVLTARHASLVINSDIYLIGGRGAGGNLLNNFQKFNTVDNSWTAMPSIAGGGFLNTTAVYLPNTNRIYLPGGSIQSSDQAYSRDHKQYIFDESRWVIANESVGGDSVTDAFAYAAAAPNNAGDGYFLTGGVVGQGYPLTTTSTVRNQVLFYEPSSDEWTELEEMTSPRYGHVAANVGGQLCVAGGIDIQSDVISLISTGECASGADPSEWFVTLPMNVPRYFAHSSVSPDGRWYVYGGIDATGAVVPEVEVYDKYTKTWSVLGLLNDMGGYEGKPVVWPGGGFVGNYLWAAGGSYDPTGSSLNPQVEKLLLLGTHTYLPIILNTQSTDNHSFSDAWNIQKNVTYSQNFESTRKLVNIYTFDITQLSPVEVSLTDIASGANLNLYLYGDQKDLIASNDSPLAVSSKMVSATLGPGRYYVMVRYVFSPNLEDFKDYYQLRVNN